MQRKTPSSSKPPQSTVGLVAILADRRSAMYPAWKFWIHRSMSLQVWSAILHAEKHLDGEMLRKGDRELSTTGGLFNHFVRCSPMQRGTQVRTLARKRPESVMPGIHGQAGAAGTDLVAFAVGTADVRNPVVILAIGAETLV